MSSTGLGDLHRALRTYSAALRLITQLTASGVTCFGLAACSGEESESPPQSGVGGTGGLAASGGRSGSGGASGATQAPAPTGTTYGAAISGQYHLGPVDFAESQWHNACAPAGGYRNELRAGAGLGGEYLAGLSNEQAQNGARCDACILIRTATGRSIVARVVTYGVSGSAGDIDVSPSVFEALNTGEYPRSMTWQLTDCPGTAKIQYEFQTGANVWWTSFWVRNAKLPIDKVEVKSANHPNFVALRRELDGTLNADSGFGEGAFTLRLTGPGGRTLMDTFPGFQPGQLLPSTQQF